MKLNGIIKTINQKHKSVQIILYWSLIEVHIPKPLHIQGVSKNDSNKPSGKLTIYQ